MAGGFYKDQYGEDKATPAKAISESISGPKKAAIVMVALGSKASSEIFKNPE